MKIRTTLLLCMTLLMSSGVWAQSLTTKNAKVVPGFISQGGATISFEMPAAIGGWQMELSLPEGLSIETSEVTIGGSKTSSPSDVNTTSSKHQIYGTTKENGDVVLLCIPTESKASLGASGQLCTIKLKAAAGYTTTGTVTIKSFIASDTAGEVTYKLSGSPTFDVVVMKGDVNGDGIVAVADIVGILNVISKSNMSFESTSDVNGDGITTVADIVAVLNEISM